MMFSEYKRPSWTDKLNRLNFTLRIGDRVKVRATGKRGVVINRFKLRDHLARLSEHEAKSLMDRLKAEYDEVDWFCIYQVMIKDLILELEPSDIEPDNSHEERETAEDESKKVEDARSQAESEV